MNNYVKLNIGGKFKEVTTYNLLKIPVFETVLNNDNITTPIFIDRDPKLFDDVINYVVWNISPSSNEALFEMENYGLCFSDDEQELKRVHDLGTKL